MGDANGSNWSGPYASSGTSIVMSYQTNDLNIRAVSNGYIITQGAVVSVFNTVKQLNDFIMKHFKDSK